jgi:hypothetical protein
MNGTVDLLADNSHQGNTARLGFVGTEHEDPGVGQLAGQLHRHSVIAGFGPVERDTVEGAAGAAGKTGIIAHLNTINLLKIIEKLFYPSERRRNMRQLKGKSNRKIDQSLEMRQAGKAITHQQ